MALLRVTEAFVVFRSGNPEFYNPGELVDETDPVIKGREALFGPEDPPRVVRIQSPAPTPSRRRGRPAKTAAAPKKRAARKSAAKRQEPPTAPDTSSSEVL